MKYISFIRYIFLISYLFLFLPSLSFAQTQNEAISIPQFNAPFNRTYNGEANGDAWWKFNAKAGEGVTISITGHFDAGFVRVKLYNEDGIEINTVNGVDNNTTKFFDEAIAVTGTYYLKISGSGLGTYDLAIYQAWYNAGINDNDRNFYSDFTTARYLSNGAYTRTSPPTGSPADDFYRFTANAGSALAITLAGNFNSGYVRLNLYDVNHVSIASSGSISAGDTKILSEDINLSGLYYLQVTGSGVGEYTLSVTGTNSNIDSDSDALKDAAEYYHATNPFQPDTDVDGVNDYTELTDGKKPSALSEYNDAQVGKQKPQAILIPYRDDNINAEYLRGEHWWKFNAIAQEEITIALTGHFNSSYIYARLYNDNGTELNTVGTISDREQGIFNQVIPSTGTYYLKVYGSGYGNYDLTIYNDRNHTDLVDEDRDFYFNHPTAHYLSSSSYSRYSKLNGGGSFDQYYYFTANAGSTLDISLTGHFNTGYVYFKVLYTSGTELAGMVSPSIDDGETESRSKQLNINGSFYLKVWGSGVGTYDLTASGYNMTSPVPETVSGVQASDGTYSNKVRITWSSTSTATSYKVYRCTSNSISSCSFLSTDSNSPYDDTSGVAGTTYHYRVEACNASGCSTNYSSANSGYRSAGSRPGVVSGVNASDGIYPNKIRINWNSTSTATSYKIYRCGTISVSSCSFIANKANSPYYDTNNQSGVYYYYRVKACDAVGCVNYSLSNSGYKTEPNDTPATANNIKFNSQLRQSIEPANDTDLVKFTLSSPSSVRIRTFYSTSHDTQLWLYDANGSDHSIAYNDDASDTLYSAIEYNCTAPLSAGDYLIKIQSYHQYAEIPAYYLILDNVEPCTSENNDPTSIIPIIELLLDE